MTAGFLHMEKRILYVCHMPKQIYAVVDEWPNINTVQPEKRQCGKKYQQLL